MFGKKKIKIVKFLGGLGNQMFQYAFYLALKERFQSVKADVSGFKHYKLHNGLELERIFNIRLDRSSSWDNWRWGVSETALTTRIRRHFTQKEKRSYFEETGYSQYNPAIFENDENLYFWGYWQNERYFIQVKEKLRQAFLFKEPLDARNEKLIQQMKDTTSVSLHVRRGDYIGNPLLVLNDATYYNAAINYMKTHVASPVFFVFSDDIAWCKSAFNLENVVYVDWNNRNESYRDMQLMSNCRHNIIANSSFSWWAAWLNSAPDKIVMAPKHWLNDPEFNIDDLIPATWVKL